MFVTVPECPSVMHMHGTCTVRAIIFLLSCFTYQMAAYLKLSAGAMHPSFWSGKPLGFKLFGRIDQLWATTTCMRAMQSNLVDTMEWSDVLQGGHVAMDADVACRETFLTCLKCIHSLLTLPAMQTAPHLPFLGRILHAFSGNITMTNCRAGSNNRSSSENPSAPGAADLEHPPLTLDLREESWHNHFEAPDLTELVKRVEKAFGLFSGWLRGPLGVLDHDILVLKVLRELVRLPDRVLVGAGVSHVGVFTHLPGRQQKVSASPLLPSPLLLLGILLLPDEANQIFCAYFLGLGRVLIVASCPHSI